jgi:hypothetical protein
LSGLKLQRRAGNLGHDGDWRRSRRWRVTIRDRDPDVSGRQLRIRFGTGHGQGLGRCCRFGLSDAHRGVLGYER